MSKSALAAIRARSMVTVVVGIVAVLLGWLLLDRPGRSDSYEPLLSREVTPADGLPNGFMVWSSNRAGKHDIYRQIGTPVENVTRLTFDEDNDSYPDIYLFEG